jgi:poly(3-hydroxybutyrate) depolymerase
MASPAPASHYLCPISAAAAVRTLQHLPTVDPARVFILGHSIGGKVAPRVASAETSIAGLVILAGDAQPMHHAAIRVARYLASLNPDPAMQAAAETLIRQVALIDSPALSPSTPAEYGPAQHIDPIVFADIAQWLMPHRGVLARIVSAWKRYNS